MPTTERVTEHMVSDPVITVDLTPAYVTTPIRNFDNRLALLVGRRSPATPVRSQLRNVLTPPLVELTEEFPEVRPRPWPN